MNNFIDSFPKYYKDKAEVAFKILVESGYSDSLFTREVVKRIASSVKLNFNKDTLCKAVERAKNRNMKSAAFVLDIYSKIHPEGVWSKNIRK